MRPPPGQQEPAPCYQQATKALEVFIPFIGSFGLAIQAGGANGTVPRLLSRYFDRVITFEPSMDTGELPSNVTLVRGVLGDGRPVKFVPNGEKSHVSGWGDTPTIRLDSYPKPDFLWLDVEGSELRVFDGADLPDLIAVEVKRKKWFFEAGVVQPYLKERGYEEVASYALDRLFRRER